MPKLKITRSDGAVIEAEGEVDDLLKLIGWLIPMQLSWTSSSSFPLGGFNPPKEEPTFGPTPYPPHSPGQHFTGCLLSCPF